VRQASFLFPSDRSVQKRKLACRTLYYLFTLSPYVYCLVKQKSGNMSTRGIVPCFDGTLLHLRSSGLLIKAVAWTDWWHNICILSRKKGRSCNKQQTKTNSVASVRKRNTQTEGPLLVGEVSDNYWGYGVCVVSTTDPYGPILGY
jgi:hypothetical protein